MRWKPIRKLTDADLEKGWMHNRLMLWNSCNGPVDYRYVPLETADDTKRERIWEKFLRQLMSRSANRQAIVRLDAAFAAGVTGCTPR